jgi:hypothetical protein
MSPEPLETPHGGHPMGQAGPSPLAPVEGDARFWVLVEQIRNFAIFLITPDGRHASLNAGVRRVLGNDAGESAARVGTCAVGAARSNQACWTPIWPGSSSRGRTT